MAFRKYTQCYAHTPGDKPFNEADLALLAVLHGVLPGVLFGALAGLAAGLLTGGPIGAVIGLAAGLFSGATVGVALALTEGSRQWRFHRLVCLSGVQCAVGTVQANPARGDLGQLDNDQFFDLALMPHRTEASYAYRAPSDNFRSGKPGLVDPAVQATLDAHPANDVYIDGLQGTALLAPSIADLPYETDRSWLHCEAEGDFWVRMNDLATALGALVGVLTVATAAATGVGVAQGAATGCTIGGIFGPIGCLIGGILGGLLGGLLGGGAAAAVSYAIVQAALQGIFDADPGNVEDANVGDAALGPISAGDRVAVLGEHVYDGFHQGWHELHPLMAVVKLGAESPFYLEWEPGLPAGAAQLADLPDMPAGITGLTEDDRRAGLESAKFRDRTVWLRDRWCEFLREGFDGTVGRAQQGLTERWTIHPSVDGCVPAPAPPDSLH